MANENDESDEVTSNTNTRWTYIGTVLAACMIISLPAVIIGGATGALALSSVGQAWAALYAIVTLMAATWAFGEETLNAVQKVRGK